MGALSIDWGFLNDAKVYLNKSLKIKSEYYDPVDTNFYKLFYKLGTYYFYKRDYDSSLFYYKKSLRTFDYGKTSLIDLSNNFQSLGIIYTRKGNIIEAENYFLRSKSISDKIFENNYDKLSLIYLNFGMFYLSIGDYFKSLELLSKSEMLTKKSVVPNIFRLHGIYWNIGLNLLFLEDNEMSIKYLEKALQICIELYKDNHEYQFPIMMDLAVGYDILGMSQLAKKNYQICLQTKDNKLKVKVLNHLASLHQKNGTIDSANYYLHNALSIAESEGFNDSLSLANIYKKYGEYLLKMSNDIGLDYLNKAHLIYSKNLKQSGEILALIYFSFGEYFFQKNNFDNALVYFNKASSELYSKSSSFKLAINDSIKYIISPLLIKVLIQESLTMIKLYETSGQQEKISSAIVSFERCFNQIHKLLSLYNNQETRLELTRKHENIYGQAIHACRMAFYETRDSSFLHKAFDFSERNKSMNLLMAIKDEDAKELGNIPDSLKVRERELKLTRNIYNKSLHEEKSKEKPDQNKINYLNDKLLPLESEYNSLLHLLEKDYPDYFTLKYDFSTTSAKRIQSILGDHEMLLEYTLGEDSIYIFGITSKRFDLLAKKIDSNMIKDIFTLRSNLKLWDIQNYGEGNFIEYQACATRLFDLLFRPFDTVPGIESIIIIPDDEIGYLSFDILLSEQTKNGKVDFRGLPFLIKKYRISYAPSASIYAYNLGKNQMTSQKGLLAFAPVYNSQLEDYFNAGMDISSNRRNLPGAIDEVKNIPRKYFGKKFLANMATENNFKKNAGLYDILHLAMHTRISDDYPMTSVLKFYPSGHNKEDDLLHTYEIFNLKLSSRMVVLSACSSGNGKLEKGEGINSLARAFLYAGAKSIIMTLWDVEDGASRKLVTDFYDFLANGLSKDEALRQAKLKYLEEVSYLKEGHPYFWSGYVVYGDTEPIIYPMISFGRIKSDLPWLILSVLFVFSSLVLFTRYLDRRRKTQQWRHSYTRKILKKRSAFPR